MRVASADRGAAQYRPARYWGASDAHRAAASQELGNGGPYE